VSRGGEGGRLTTRFKLRAVHAEDTPLISDWLASAEEARQWSGGDTPFPIEPEWLVQAFGGDQARYYVLAESETDEPVGLFGLRWRGAGVHLVRIALAPEWRGLGLARPLLRAAETLARDGGARRMTLNVYADNEPARRAYEAAGFFLNEVAADRYGQVLRMTKPLGRGEPE
jgi:RimJ/RimL family protein N-acetyltransferase